MIYEVNDELNDGLKCVQLVGITNIPYNPHQIILFNHEGKLTLFNNYHYNFLIYKFNLKADKDLFIGTYYKPLKSVLTDKVFKADNFFPKIYKNKILKISNEKIKVLYFNYNTKFKLNVWKIDYNYENIIKENITDIKPGGEIIKTEKEIVDVFRRYTNNYTNVKRDINRVKKIFKIADKVKLIETEYRKAFLFKIKKDKGILYF